MLHLTLALAASLVLSMGCGSPVSKSPKKAPAGNPGEPCFADGSCNAGSVCEDGTCRAVVVEEDAGPSTDAGGDAGNNGSLFCGNGRIDSGEECDGSDLGGSACGTLGFDLGQLQCSASCQFDSSECSSGAVCGDGILEAGESCDGTALGGTTCASLGYTGGSLRCDDTCQDFDVSDCTSDSCGDGVANGAEDCDGSDLRATCSSLGYTAGTLRCDSSCEWDFSGCTICGDGTAEGAEVCDGASLRGATCQSRTGQSGQLRCNSTCDDYDISGCGATLVCDYASSCPSPDNNAPACECYGCVDDGVCVPASGVEDDCICADCKSDNGCTSCNNDGKCDPYVERCSCADCAAHPRCAP